MPLHMTNFCQRCEDWIVIFNALSKREDIQELESYNEKMVGHSRVLYLCTEEF